MSDGAGEVEGGLDEPDGLQPDPGSLALASADDDWSRADWAQAAAGVLRKIHRLQDGDADDAVWSALAHTTYDGISISPLGTPDLLSHLSTSGRPTRAGSWDIRTRVDGDDVARANDEALTDLRGGATSLWLRVDDAADLAGLLDGVLPDLPPVVLDPRDAPVAAAEALIAYTDGGLAVGTNLGVDGEAPEDDLVAVAELARTAGTLGVVVDATRVHDRGASDAQELGHSIAVGVRALRVLTAAGVPLDEAAGLMEFRYAATGEQFPTIAKLRAARRLWARVLELSGSAATWQRQHAVTSRPMMSRYDPWVNLLRTTVAAFAAGVGGAESVTVLPFDGPLGRPDAFGRRIARNTSSLLVSEAHVAAVADAAGGAFAVEKLTDDLALTAWDLLGTIEGGGSLDDVIAATVAARDADVATRTRPITGLSEFPHAGETLPARPGPGDDVRRYGAAFEALRDRPATKPVFLATLGPVAAHTARAGFAGNLFAAGGIPLDVAGATDGVDDVVAAYDGQSVVCLAGADLAYDEWGAEVVTALRDAGATWVILAGRPVDGVDADDTCTVGDNAIEFLTRTREKLG